MKCSSQKIEDFMKRVFYKLGLSIGYHPWRLYRISVQTDRQTDRQSALYIINNARITYTDSESASHVEARVLQTFLQQNGTLNMVEIMIESKDNGSLLREDYRHQIWDLIHEINTEITIKNSSGHQLTYRDMCEPYCQKNDAFIALLELYNKNFSRVEVTYPTMDILGKQIFIASNIYGVSLVNDTNTIESFTTVILRYYMVYPEIKPLLAWETKIVSLLYDSGKYDLLNCSAGSDNLVAKEVKEMGNKSAPLLSISLGMLMIFLMLCSFRYKRRESKPLEAILGGVTPLLAGITTVGLVSATGLAFQSIVVSTLFLVLAIGIDDVFIMLAAWHRTEKSMDIPKRTAEMVQVSGSSMTVTSITNVISFGNGVLSSTPALQTFAIYSVAASVICYFYQLILFPAILTLTAHKEYKTIDSDSKSGCLPEELPCIKDAGKFHDRAWKGLARLVVKPWMQALTIMVLIVYWAFTYYGISIVQTDLSVQKLAPPDARIVQFKTRYDDIIRGMQTVAIVVTTPGDLRDPKRFADVATMIRDYETASYSYGKESTFCFLGPYMDFLTFREVEEEDQEVVFTYTHIPDFLESDTFWKGTMRTNETACKLNEPSCLPSFLFTTGFTTLSSYKEMFPLIQEWRAISSKHPDLGVYAYSERSTYADQTDALGDVIWQTLYSEVICMGISFIVFIPDIVSIAAAMFSLLSVNLGVFGFLVLWGVGIDPISMASLLMSIGFSVDISAHISYHYYLVKAPTPVEKLEDAFLNIGWPTMQGGLSTLFAMLPVLIKPSYLGMVFLKTVALVSIFGLIHGLIVLPVFLSMFTSLRRKFGFSAVAPAECDNSDSGSSTCSIPPHRISIKSFTVYKGDQ
uniref:SSD domain-containing protein n=1 Tax=Haemonchus contortus TaxID=6289 RepID=A0A7I4YYR3_HAECO